MSMSLRTRVQTSCVAIAGGMLWVGLGIASAQTPDPAKVALGAKTFEDSKCEKCHGPEGMGNKDKKLSLVGVSPKLSAADIHKWIATPEAMTAKLPRQPIEPMKKVDLTEAQVDALVAYVQSLKK
jgi:mono/diheme cytochrome c family protein